MYGDFPTVAGWMLILWLTLIGAAVGSFLNVVVYRLPRGMSLIEPPSHCPNCRRRIRWYDNVPVLAWFWLRGRCRDCRAKISLRYPLVEAATAVLFGGLLAVELQWPNFAPRTEELSVEGVRIVASNMGVLYGVYLYHLLLLCTLFCAGLMEWDGCAAPRKLYFPVLAIGVLLPFWKPELRLPTLWPIYSTRLVSIVESLSGLVAGAFFGGLAGWLLALLQKRINPRTSAEDPAGTVPAAAAGLLCVGVYLGWQAATITAVTTALLLAILWPLRRFWTHPRSPVGMLLTVGAITYLISLAILAPAIQL